MLLIATCKNTKNNIFLKLKNPITMHIAHVIGFLFLLKIREIFIFNIMFTAFIKILPVGELPTHNHNASTNNVNQNGNIGWLQAGKDYNFSGVFATSSKNQGANVSNGESTGVWNCIFDSTHSHNVTINNTGSNQSHNNLQPYISVYIWKRTA